MEMEIRMRTLSRARKAILLSVLRLMRAETFPSMTWNQYPWFCFVRLSAAASPSHCENQARSTVARDSVSFRSYELQC